MKVIPMSLDYFRHTITDEELFSLMEEKLYAAVIADACDQQGFPNQGMDHRIRLMTDSAVKVAGRAMTILTVDIYEITDDPYGREIEAIDNVKVNDIVVVCTNYSVRAGFWGQILSTAARARGAKGAVLDGLTRDVEKIKQMGFPVFACGRSGLDSKGRMTVVNYNCPVVCGGVLVRPGEIVFGDSDGVVVIPREREKEILEASFAKVEKENRTLEELRKGKFLREAYKKYGVL